MKRPSSSPNRRPAGCSFTASPTSNFPRMSGWKDGMSSAVPVFTSYPTPISAGIRPLMVYLQRDSRRFSSASARRSMPRWRIPGDDLPGVYEATDFLIRGNVDSTCCPRICASRWRSGSRVVVIGGGDTASDCLRTALRLGAEDVTCLYRRTESEMPGGQKDRQMAKDEGARYRFLTQPVQFIAGAGWPAGRGGMHRDGAGRAGCQRPAQARSGGRLEFHRCLRYSHYWPSVTGRTRSSAKRPPDSKTHDWGLITGGQGHRRHLPAGCVCRRRLMSPAPTWW